MIVCGLLAALDHAADRAVKEGVHAVIEGVERRNGMFVLVLDGFRYDLKAVQHGALCTGVVFSCCAVLPDFGENLLDQNELIWHKRIIHNEFLRAAVALDVQNRIREAEEVLQHIIIAVIEIPEDGLRFRLLCQEPLLDNFIHGRGGQGKPCLKSCLNTGEFIHTDLDDFIDGFLSGADDPYLPATLAADLLYE